jgi:hypothetical protein
MYLYIIQRVMLRLYNYLNFNKLKKYKTFRLTISEQQSKIVHYAECQTA